MAVGANTYGTVAAVERLVGDLVTGKAFGAGTEPNTTDVELALDDVANELNAVLEGVGYTAPVAVADDPIAHAYLVTANNYGAAAAAIGLLPVGAFNPEISQEENAPDRQAMYQQRFNAALEMIRAGELKAARAVSRLGRVQSGARLDDAGRVKKPLFTVGRDHHGERNLTE